MRRSGQVLVLWGGAVGLAGAAAGLAGWGKRRGGFLAGLLAAGAAGLGLAGLVALRRHVLNPLGRLAGGPGAQDEVQAVATRVRRLEAEADEARRSLEQSRNRLLSSEKLATVGKLAAGVAHEIRNPLTSLKMRLFAIRRGLGDDPLYEDDLRVVSEEVGRLEHIIRNFLEFARPPALKVEVRPAAALIESALELMGYPLEERGIQVRYEYPGHLLRVRADAEQIKQVFLNVLSNAADAIGEEGWVRISVSTSAGAGHPYVVIRFQDSGPGVPEAIRERIFEPFFSTKEQGTGLGLCIARQIMEQHGGRLEFEPGAGATFAVWIPAVAGEEDEQNPGC